MGLVVPILYETRPSKPRGTMTKRLIKLMDSAEVCIECGVKNPHLGHRDYCPKNEVYDVTLIAPMKGTITVERDAQGRTSATVNVNPKEDDSNG